MDEVQGNREQQHGNRLVCRAEEDGHGKQQRRDTEYHLHYCRVQQRVNGGSRPGRHYSQPDLEIRRCDFRSNPA